MEQLVRVAACNLNQWALDFDLNLANVVESIRIAKEAGCTFRTGPELELSGYGCQDHFLEMDTIMHCWESLAALLKGDLTDGILCDVGMPLLHRSTRYNCRVFLLNRKIVGIRPKLHLANEGNYRERRWFTAWTRMFELDEFWLPSTVAEVTGQQTVPFGIFIVRANDTSLASETCEELWAPESPNIIESLNGAEIIANGSGSHHNLRKLAKRLDLIRSATVRNGGVYLYSNQQGCDGDRLYYDGSSMICLNGQILQQASQFSVNDIEVLTATIDLQQVRSFRAYVSSRSQQSAGARSLPEIKIDFNMTKRGGAPPTVPREPSLHTPEEEIAYGPSCWLWDYMRRSGASGFFLPLSGGADSSSTATLVGIMCRQVVDAVAAGNERVLADARRVAGEDADSDYAPTDPREFANRIMHTCYMGTENSSVETRARARRLAEEIGTYHMDTDIDKLVSSMLWVFEKATGKRPRFRSNGGSNAENLAMQNIQARLRMVLSYLLAQLLPWVRGRGGFLLVLGSANVDEALRGYMTKYDCSSADINPIGGIAKADLRRFLAWSAEHMGYTSLLEIVEAPPTAELEPITAEYTQSDEVDMGMTYAELGIFGRLRKMYQCGPVSMFERLKHTWSHISPTEVASKVKKFFKYYSINRHKLTTLTPAYHAEEYSPDDNRYDLRQFLYNTKWPRQFRLVDALAELAESSPAQEPENPAFVVSANL